MTEFAPDEVRQKLGLTITEMHTIMEVHRETWAKWVRWGKGETGGRKPNTAARTLMKVFIWMHKRGYLKEYLAEKSASDEAEKQAQNKPS
jgi:DNA-binding transcriptional regulator YiaG